MGGYVWHVMTVHKNSEYLIDRTGTLTVATTDPVTRTVYLSEALSGEFKHHVIIHELGHCALFSYGLLDDIHHMTKPEYWVEIEELICNIIADYGYRIFEISRSLMGDYALRVVPQYIDSMIA